MNETTTVALLMGTVVLVILVFAFVSWLIVTFIDYRAAVNTQRAIWGNYYRQKTFLSYIKTGMV